MKGFPISWNYFLLLHFLLLYVFNVGQFGVVLIDAKSKAEEYKEFLALVDKFVQENAHNGDPVQGFTFAQLQQYFLEQIGKDKLFEEYPRLYPFCVTHKLIEDPKRTKEGENIKHFEHAIEDVEVHAERFYAFDKEQDSTYQNQTWVKEIRISRINTPELDMVNLRQWVHIRVETAFPVHGLYMQSIVGPMGLPFGEFNLDFPCQDDPTSADMETVGDLVECTYRPRSAIVHPSAYAGYDENKRTIWHTNFLWTDITCMETPYVQFLMLVGKDLDKVPAVRGLTYQAMFSPVYLNKKFDSLSGAPFPYYPVWKDEMYCFLDNATFIQTYKAKYPKEYPGTKAGSDPLWHDVAWTITLETFRVQPSEVYDVCITSETYKDRDDVRLECPPGPFRCDKSYGDLMEHEVEAQRQELVTNEENLSDCAPCIIPSCLESGFPREKCQASSVVEIDVFELAEDVEIAEKHGRVKGHGILSMMGFLVLVPLANYMGRFFKEANGGFMCGNGPWILLHILLQVLGLVFVWLSVGPVTNEVKAIRDVCKEEEGEGKKECYKEQVLENTHAVLGIATVFVYHFVLVFSFWRSASMKLRHVQTAFHSHFGYFTWILAAITGVVGTGIQCYDALLFNLFLFLMPLLFSGIATAIDCALDKRVGILPPRKQWPTLEPVQLQGNSPYSKVKWILFGVFIFIQLLLWTIAFVAANRANETVEEGLVALIEAKGKSIPGKATIENGTRYVYVDGVFDDDCKVRIRKARAKMTTKTNLTFAPTTTTLRSTAG